MPSVLFAACVKQATADPKSRAGSVRDHVVLVVPLYGPNAYNSRKEHSNLILRADIPVQTKLFESERKQSKVCVSVESRGFVCHEKVAKGINKKKRCRIKHHLNQTGASLCKAAKQGGMRHRFGSTLQVTSLPDAIPLAPRSPHLITHRHTRADTHRHQTDTHNKS